MADFGSTCFALYIIPIHLDSLLHTFCIYVVNPKNNVVLHISTHLGSSRLILARVGGSRRENLVDDSKTNITPPPMLANPLLKHVKKLHPPSPFELTFYIYTQIILFFVNTAFL